MQESDDGWFEVRAVEGGGVVELWRAEDAVGCSYCCRYYYRHHHYYYCPRKSVEVQTWMSHRDVGEWRRVASRPKTHMKSWHCGRHEHFSAPNWEFKTTPCV